MDVISNKLFTCSKTLEHGYKIDFGPRSSNEQIEVSDYYYLWELSKLACNNKFTVTGRNTVAAFFATCFYLTLWGAKEIVIEMPDAKQYILLEENNMLSEEKLWLNTKTTSTLEIISNPNRVDGIWEDDVLQNLNKPILFSNIANDDKPISVTGKSTVLIYGALGVNLAKFHSNKIVKLHLPQLPYEVVFSRDKIEKEPYTGTSNGIVIGILGDPNSGKSVFSHSFSNFLKNKLANEGKVWLYDCDMASPTPSWYLKNTNKDSLETQTREKINTKWSSQLERKVATDLKIMRTNLNFVIADMPGGRHPKADDNFTAQRIPSVDRAEMMKACDIFVVLCRMADDKIFAGWKDSLQQYGLEKRIIARFNTFLDEEKVFRVDKITRNSIGMFETNIYNLDRSVPENVIINKMDEALDDFVEYVRCISLKK